MFDCVSSTLSLTLIWAGVPASARRVSATSASSLLALYICYYNYAGDSVLVLRSPWAEPEPVLPCCAVMLPRDALPGGSAVFSGLLDLDGSRILARACVTGMRGSV